MGPKVSHRQAVQHAFEGLVDIRLDNLVVGIEEHTIGVDTMEAHYIEFSQIMASLDSIEQVDYNEFAGCENLLF